MSTTQSAAVRVAEEAAGRRWAVIGLLSLGMIIAYASRSNLSVALVTQDFIRSFHLSDTDRGLLNSAFFWAYAALQIPAGWVVDRYGVKWPYALSFLFWCLASAGNGTGRHGGAVDRAADSAGHGRKRGRAGELSMDPHELRRAAARTRGRAVHDRDEDRPGDRHSARCLADSASRLAGDVRDGRPRRIDLAGPVDAAGQSDDRHGAAFAAGWRGEDPCRSGGCWPVPSPGAR